MTDPIITFHWTGREMVPLGRCVDAAAEAFEPREQYRMVVSHVRSWKTHAHFFAAVHEAWMNLPEDIASMPWAQTDEHLRKYALIKTRWNTVTARVCMFKTEALRTAGHIRSKSTFSLVVVEGKSVLEFEPRSQSYPAMSADEFQQSKEDVLGFLEELLGVEPGTLSTTKR